MDREGRIGDKIIRRPRIRDVLPEVVKSSRIRQPSRHFTPPFILFYSFAGLILLGGLLLYLPLSQSPVSEEQAGRTTLHQAFFTATSAVTVTGHVVVDTPTHWSSFGHGVIFSLMLVGGLGFTSLATFFLIIIGQRITLPERMLMRDTMGVNRLGGLVSVLRNIILIVVTIYAIGTRGDLVAAPGHFLGRRSGSGSPPSSLYRPLITPVLRYCPILTICPRSSPIRPSWCSLPFSLL